MISREKCRANPRQVIIVWCICRVPPSCVLVLRQHKEVPPRDPQRCGPHSVRSIHLRCLMEIGQQKSGRPKTIRLVWFCLTAVRPQLALFDSSTLRPPIVSASLNKRKRSPVTTSEIAISRSRLDIMQFFDWQCFQQSFLLLQGPKK